MPDDPDTDLDHEPRWLKWLPMLMLSTIPVCAVLAAALTYCIIGSRHQGQRLAYAMGAGVLGGVFGLAHYARHRAESRRDAERNKEAERRSESRWTELEAMPIDEAKRRVLSLIDEGDRLRGLPAAQGTRPRFASLPRDAEELFRQYRRVETTGEDRELDFVDADAIAPATCPRGATVIGRSEISVLAEQVLIVVDPRTGKARYVWMTGDPEPADEFPSVWHLLLMMATKSEDDRLPDSPSHAAADGN